MERGREGHWEGALEWREGGRLGGSIRVEGDGGGGRLGGSIRVEGEGGTLETGALEWREGDWEGALEWREGGREGAGREH